MADNEIFMGADDNKEEQQSIMVPVDDFSAYGR